MNIDNITSINNIIINRKTVDNRRLALKYFRIFPKHNVYFLLLTDIFLQH